MCIYVINRCMCVNVCVHTHIYIYMCVECSRYNMYSELGGTWEEEA